MPVDLKTTETRAFPNGDKRSKTDLLGNYRLIEKIAQGGMAEIYRAQTVDPNGLTRDVVIKRILPHISSHQEFVDMLIDEAKIAVQFNHGNIAQVYDLGKVGKDYFIVMEYVEGKTLQQLIKRAKALDRDIPIPICLYIVAEMCAGLDHMHRKTDASGTPLHVVHRDISPQNIIITPSANVKIIDFGIAKAADKITVTEAGVLKGKFAYMSPEQALGEAIDARSDIFAAGIVLWELLSRERLFRKETNAQTLKAVKKADIPDLPHAVPKSVIKVIHHALAKNPKKRYEMAEAFQRDLTQCLFEDYPEFKPAHLSEFIDHLFSDQTPTHEPKDGSLLFPKHDLASDDKTPLRPMQLLRDPLPHPETDPRARLSKDTPKPIGSTISVGEDTLRVRIDAIDHEPVIRSHQEHEQHEDTSQAPEELSLGVPMADLPLYLAPDSPSSEEARNTHAKKGVFSRYISTRRFSQIQRLGLLFIVLIFLLLGFTIYRQFNSSPKPLNQPNAQQKEDLTPVKNPPTLIAESDPSGADIYINDQQTGKKTPAVLTDLEANVPIRIAFSGQGFKYLERSITLKNGQTETLHLSLETNTGIFSFITEPRGAFVTLNGNRIGSTPILNYSIDPDTVVTLRLTAPGYRPVEKTFKVHGGERERIIHVLEPLAQ